MSVYEHQKIPDALCKKCGLYLGCNNPFIVGEGNSDDPLIVFVGEAPGEEEDAKGRPFVGRAGRLLRRAVAEAKATDEVYYTNTCMCRPPANKLEAKHQKCCSDRLTHELAAVCSKRTVIVPLGNKPMRALLGKGYKISQHRMTRIDIEGRVVIPNYHPSYIVRNAHMAGDWVDSIKEIVEIARGHSNLAQRPDDPDDIGDYRLVSPQEFVAYCDSSPIVAVDVECNTLRPLLRRSETRLLTVAASARSGEAVCLPVSHPEAEHEVSESIAAIKRALSGKACIGQNFKYDSHVLFAVCGVQTRHYFDTMLAHHILHPVRGRHSLSAMAMSVLGIGDYEKTIHDMLSAMKTKDYTKLPLTALWKYNCTDADVTFRLYEIFKSRLEEDSDSHKVFYSLAMPLSNVYAYVERTGIGLDIDYANKLLAEERDTEASILGELQSDPFAKSFSAAQGKYINFNSSMQVRHVLFDESYYGMEPVKTTPKGDPSVDASVLKVLAEEHDCAFARNLLQLRKTAKLISTYLVPPASGKWLGEDNRVHSTFNIGGTATGRLSSSDPNLHNIPRDGRIRGMFVAGPGRVFVSADYSQMELRVLAIESMDTALLEAFEEQRDIHSYTAARLFGVDESEVTTEQRHKAKTINFGLSYGMSAKGFADRTGVSVEEGEEFIEQYFSEFPGVHDWIMDVRRFAAEEGYVKSFTGRRRLLPEAQLPYGGMKEAALREAVNMPIQSAASDLCQYSVIDVYNGFRRHPRWGAKIMLSLHDEVLVECLEESVGEVSEFMEKQMPGTVDRILGERSLIPFPVDTVVGKRWQKG